MILSRDDSFSGVRNVIHRATFVVIWRSGNGLLRGKALGIPIDCSTN
jgi:hypothetical protein